MKYKGDYIFRLYEIVKITTKFLEIIKSICNEIKNKWSLAFTRDWLS